MPPRGIPASFHRGGTSRGLLLRADVLAPFSPLLREHIIRTALGSPDPGARQISGLGGGVSSLSKTAIIGAPGEGKEAQEVYGALPGVSWADRGDLEGVRYDVVYRFAQVGVRDTGLDWTATCGNMLSAVALTALATPILPYSTIFARARSLPQPPLGSPLLFPLTILSASNGLLMRARVPLDPHSLQVWEPAPGEGCTIAGVPGEEVGIEVEMPIEVVEGVEGGLVTGRARDSVTLHGVEIPISILSSGLPNIFVNIASLPSLSPTLLASPVSALTTHPTLPSLLELIRTTASSKFSIPLSLASPKIILLSSIPESGYETSTRERVAQSEADLLVRAVSSGDFHATIPGTTLGALNLGVGIPGTVIHELVGGGEGRGEEVVTVRAGHAAGVASSSVRFVVGEMGKRVPTSVVMMRTAREIMRGEVMVPQRFFEEEE